MMKGTRMNRTTGFLFGAIAVAAAAPAQDLTHTAPAQRRPVVIEGATIHTVSDGVIEDGTVWFADGEIREVLPAGRQPELPDSPDPEHIDADGLHVYPGLISANTALGLTEISAVRATRDFAETGGITPEVRAAVAVNPDSTLIPVARRNGILVAGVRPSSGAIPGRASVMQLEGWTWEDMAIDDAAGLVVNWPRMRPIDAWWMDQSEQEQRKEAKENVRRIKEAFADARSYYKAKRDDPTIPTDVRWEAMRAAIKGEKPVFIQAQEYEQIQSAVSWANDEGLNAVIVGGRDAPLAADLLKRHDIPVMLTGTHRTPSRRDAAHDRPFRLPKMLEDAGLQWCLASSGGSFGAANERNLPYHAASAVAHGLSHKAAVRSITLSAARILGVADRLGSIEPGKNATLMITTGSPLEFTTDIERAFISGRDIDLSNKQTKLRDKYRAKYHQLGLIGREKRSESR